MNRRAFLLGAVAAAVPKPAVATWEPWGDYEAITTLETDWYRFDGRSPPQWVPGSPADRIMFTCDLHEAGLISKGTALRIMGDLG